MKAITIRQEIFQNSILFHIGSKTIHIGSVISWLVYLDGHVVKYETLFN